MPRKNANLLLVRNKKIFARYNYWFNKKNLRLDVVMHKLVWEEFFLEEQSQIQSLILRLLLIDQTVLV